MISLTDRTLKKVAKHVDLENTRYKDINDKLAENLLELMSKEKGIGLSATQVGILKRVFAINVEDQIYDVCFNPKVIFLSDEVNIAFEGCLSFPGVSFSVERPTEIAVEYQRITGELIKINLKDLAARCFLHELDHLNGITADKREKGNVRKKYINYGVIDE